MAELDFKASADRWKRYSYDYLLESRSLYYESLKTTMTIATFLIGFNVIWLQIDPNSSILVKAILTLSTLSLTVSLLFGRKVLHRAVKFLNKSADAYENKSEALNTYMLKSKKSTGGSYPSQVENIKMDYQMYPWEDKVQSVTFYVGVMASVALVLVKYFNL